MCQGFIRHRNEKILPIFVERVRNVSYMAKETGKNCIFVHDDCHLYKV
ncbi:hypothetical protein GTCCBUS3UF5_31500 [Geobacillus thermoleovorans CCB_US3_UF5]|uniref:Uncharacterized protein n=1 Tax=Geobacillus thermoleovorans CCB_US3_UF5 TaxID=1111068 RepID=A0ABN4A2B3_GEOTH|nr:hypothetical protein GTCCBUS3UF5_31500 [Geobacillus thermoleovorans CCB_US3_UF5]